MRNPRVAEGAMREHCYDSREALAEALASGVAAVLAGGIATRGQARLAVSGGSTPELFFERLSRMDLDWARVRILPVDERFVPIDHPRSNAGLIRRLLLQGRASAARLLPLCNGDEADHGEAAANADHAVAMLGGLDAAVIGMGEDGHTASFFPDGDNLAAALDVRTRHHVLAMQAPGAVEPRMTLTLRYLLEAGFIALHIEGAAKRQTLSRAVAGGSQEEMPVRALLREAGERLHLFWAP